MKTKPLSAILVAGAALLLLSACGSKAPVITIGGKATTEQKILVEILAGYLEKQMPGVKIDRKPAMGNTMVVQGALQSGAIDLSVDNTGSALASVLKEDVPSDAGVAVERVRAEFKRLYQLNVLKPLGFDQQFLLFASTAATSPVKVEALAALGASGNPIRLGAAHDFEDRKDGFQKLTTQYHVSLRALPLVLAPNEMYEALKTGTVDLGAGYSTDAWADQPEYRVVKDDLNLFPPQLAVIIVRSQALAANAGLERALDALSGKFTNESMRKMNQQVDLKHRTPADVAQEFLKSAGL